MKKSHKKFLAGVLILLTSILLIANNVLAVTAEEPMLDFTADFKYCDGINKGATWCTASGPPSNSYPYRWLLTFSGWNITGGNYIDGSYFGEGDDPITDAYFLIGNLYNDNYPDNLIFSGTQPSGGSTGPVSFVITDGSTTYFSATLDNFIVTNNYFGTSLNPAWTLDNITNPTFNTSSSQYIQELESRYNSGYKINFGMDFTFLSGVNDFTTDASGSIQGKMVVTPEPVSSLLFASGGATLAFSRYLKRRKIIPKI